MIVIVGGGLAGLVAAHALATAGKEVTLLEARSKLGGLVASEEIGGVRFDIGAESYARRATEVTDYLRGLGLETVLPAGRSWIWNGSPIQIPANTSPSVSQPTRPPTRSPQSSPTPNGSRKTWS